MIVNVTYYEKFCPVPRAADRAVLLLPGTVSVSMLTTVVAVPVYTPCATGLRTMVGGRWWAWRAKWTAVADTHPGTHTRYRVYTQQPVYLSNRHTGSTNDIL